MKVLKFGGSSVDGAARISAVLEIVSAEAKSGNSVVVCSAMKGVTDLLIAAARQAEAADASYRDTMSIIWKKHEDAVRALFSEGKQSSVLDGLASLFGEAEDLALGVSLIRECSPRSMDLMMSFGERLSNTLIAAYASSIGVLAGFVDARELICTDSHFGSAAVDFPTTNGRITNFFAEFWKGSRQGKVAFVTGFIAASADGITTTLGRNGSDYTAAIVGSALGVEDIQIWTDVDGVLSADPRIVKNAFVIPDLSVEEAMELCYFGAEVLHPYTIIPAVEKNIPIWIRNTLSPAKRGTRIAKGVPPSPHVVTGFASIQDVSLINIFGGGLVGAKGIAGRIFTCLARADANIILISQASSEHSICLAIRSEDSERAMKALEFELGALLQSRAISAIELTQSLEVLAVIGGNMRGQPGVSGKIFGALGKIGVNVLVIAQGSSEMNISFVIEQHDHEKALNALHDAFFRED